MTGLPRLEVDVAPDIAPYWEGASRGELVLPRCRDCQHLIWYPRSVCPVCSSTDIEWETLSGNGFVFSSTVVRRGSGDFADAGPYVLAYVELEEGPRVLTNVVGWSGEPPSIGAGVKAVFEPVDEHTSLLRFQPITR